MKSKIVMGLAALVLASSGCAGQIPSQTTTVSYSQQSISTTLAEFGGFCEVLGLDIDNKAYMGKVGDERIIVDYESRDNTLKITHLNGNLGQEYLIDHSNGHILGVKTLIQQEDESYSSLPTEYEGRESIFASGINTALQRFMTIKVTERLLEEALEEVPSNFEQRGYEI